MPDASRTIHAGRQLAGRYTLRRLIDRGGMAEVWEGDDRVLGRAVAVKVLYPHLAVDASFSERFRLEAIAAARLAHPNVVATYDTGVDDGLAFIVMELVDGRTLRDELAAGPVTATAARAIAAQVADALGYAHQAGIVHRDIKPANILLCPDGRAKVADFGIAKAITALGHAAGLDDGEPAKDLTGTGAIIGTAKYLSPEQVDGRVLDGRSDVYALGVVLYEMLCGRPPFTGDTEMALGIQHLSTPPPAPRSVRADVPWAMEAIVMKALEKSPDDRFPSAAALQNALERADVGGPSGAASPGVDATRVTAVPRPAGPQVGRDDTPPGGSSPISVRRPERRWLLPAAMAALVAVTLGVVGVILARSDLGGSAGDGDPAGGDGAESVPVRAAVAFDPPPGDGVEHDDELEFLFDGDPDTAWSTEAYDSQRFGNLKPGVGFVLQLDGSSPLDRLAVTSASRGWSAEALVADAARATRDEWGQPVDTKSNVGGGSVTFDLQGRTGGAVLLWITDLGDASAVEVGEATVT